MKLACFLLAAMLATGTVSLAADNRGLEVVVVYNINMPESRSVAEHYAQKRNVPAEQVFGLDMPVAEEISRMEFRDSIQRPLARALSDKKLWRITSEVVPATTNQAAKVEWKVVESKVRYAALCYGTPLRIKPDPTLKEPEMDKLRPELRRDEACVDSELAWLPLIEQRPPLFSPIRNMLYTATNSSALHPTNGLLLVSRLDGPTPEIAKGLVDKALEAERNGLWGRGYFDVRNTTEPGMKSGDDSIRVAAELCRRLGFEIVVDENPGVFPAGFPLSHIAFYLGWYAQDVTGAFSPKEVEFMPGAFAYHLHSFSAVTLRSDERGWVGPLLARGATASMGTVYEPYLAGTPDVGVFTTRFIYFGMTFAEAAWASQPVLSWQTTVVGDPLYRPFGGSPEALHDRLQREESPLLDWSNLRLVNLNLVAGRSMNDMALFIEALGGLTNSPILAEKLGDLFAAQGKPSSSAHAYQNALKLDASPQQRIRLRLTLGQRLLGLGEREKARENYQKLLEEAPDYPDKAAIEKRISQLGDASASTGP
jgi:uncharacterized protein (TIGR03790 family)